MTPTGAILEQATAALTALSVDLFASQMVWSDEEIGEVLRQVEQLGRVVEAIRTVAAGQVDDRSRRALGTGGMAYKLGCALPVHLIERVTLVAQAEGSRRLRLGAAIRPQVAVNGELLAPEFPAVADAFMAGNLGVDSARLIVRYLGEARRAAQPKEVVAAEVVAAEVYAVRFAATNSANLVEDMLIELLQRLDPDGTEPRDEEARARRGITVGREKNGMVPIHGHLHPTSAGLVKATFDEGADPKTQPSFLPEEEKANAQTEEIIDEDGTVHTRIIDPRTREQRQHDILIGTLTAGLRNTTRKSSSLRPLTTVMVTVTLDDLRNGTGAGWIDDVKTPVAASTVEQMVCDGGVTPIVLGNSGEVLYLGTPVRLFSAAQRKALAVRDGGCVWPGCTAPPSWCEAHHVLEHHKGGPTDIDNGVLLCSAHHHMLHASEFFLKMINGKPRLLSPPWLDPHQIWQPIGRTRALLRL